MSIFAKILGTDTIKSIASSIAPIIDQLTTSDDEKSKAKENLTNIVLTNLVAIVEAKKEVLKQEMKGNWLQKSWRPLTMLSFVVILICKWFGLTNSEIPVELELELMGLLKIGIGGYIGARTVEQVAKTVTENIDIPFLKKKNRKL